MEKSISVFNLFINMNECKEGKIDFNIADKRFI